MTEGWSCRLWSEGTPFGLIPSLSVLCSGSQFCQFQVFLSLQELRFPAWISLVLDHRGRRSPTLRSVLVLLPLCTGSWQILLWPTSGHKLVAVHSLSRRPPFFMLLWWSHLFVCASTFCTLCLRFVIRRTPVYPLGVWPLTSVFSLWQIFLIQSPDHGFKILLAYRLSW